MSVNVIIKVCLYSIYGCKGSHNLLIAYVCILVFNKNCLTLSCDDGDACILGDLY